MIKYKVLIIWLIIHFVAIRNIKNIRKPSFLMNVILYILFSVGITGGYHRLYTHASFQAPFLIRMVFLLLGTAAFQMPAIGWCSKHRMHHRFENSNKLLDPYSIQKFCKDDCKKICRKPHMILNFLYAHCMWLFIDNTPKFKEQQKHIIDEMKNVEWKNDYSILLLQQKYYFMIMSLLTFVIPILISKKIFKDSWKSSIGATFLRVIVIWHSTYFINSLAHLFGSRKDRNLTAVNSHLYGILTMGGGYHNYHHQYPKDYYASENLKCFNLTAWLLRSLKFVGLIHDTRRGIVNKPGEYEYKS